MRSACWIILCLAGCSAQSDGPLFAPDNALPLRAGTTIQIDLVMPDGDGGPVILSVPDDGQHLLLAAAQKNADESDEDILTSFHAVPGTPDMMITQSQIVVGTTPKNDKHGYHIIGCPRGGQFTLFKFDLLSLQDLGPFESVDFDGLYAPTATSTDGLVAYFQAAMTLDSFIAVPLEPAVECDMFFE